MAMTTPGKSDASQLPPVFRERKGEAWYCQNCNRHYTHHRGGLWFCFTEAEEAQYRIEYARKQFGQPG